MASPRTEIMTNSNREIPYFKLRLDQGEKDAVMRVLDSGWLTTGRECFAFEREFAESLGGCVECIAVNSNTSGLHLVLEAIGVGPGDEVLVPSLTFTATAEVVRYLGAEPVLVDVCRDTLCISPAAVEAAITPRCKAVMVVHFGGLAADMPALQAIAVKYGIELIEDAAHAFPASHGSTPVGTFDTAAAVFSFYANKTMTTGEGGMIVTRRNDIAKRCRLMRLHGIDRDSFDRFTSAKSSWVYDIVAPGFKYNMTDVAAALGREQLQRAESRRLKRLKIANTYLELLANLPVLLPSAGAGHVHAWHLFPIRLLGERTTREDLEVAFRAVFIGYSMHYIPLHRMSYWKSRKNYVDSDFPVSSEQGDAGISLPIYPDLTLEQVEFIADTIKSVLLK